MTVSIDATNLVEIDDADQTTGWTSSMGGLNTVTLGAREGSPATALQDQASEETYQVYHTITSEDYSDRTIFGWQRSGGPADEDDATGAGFAMYLGDGTDAIAYDVGGADNAGFFFLSWSSFRLNTVGLPTDFLVVAGVEADLTITAITQVGYGGHFPGKAAGNADNVQFDILRYVANANPALLVEGGTTGARGAWAEVVTEDESLTNAWGIAQVLIVGSKAYQIMFGLQVGSLDADAFFEDSDFQLYINGSLTSGGVISAGSMDFTFVGAALQTNAINFDNFFIQSLGAVSNWDISDTDIDELEWTNGQFVDMGTFLFQAQDAGAKFVNNCIWVNCGQVDPIGMDMDGCIFNGTVVGWGGSVVEENQDNLTFNSAGTGHAIRILISDASLTTYNISGYTVSGFDATSYDTPGGGSGNTVFRVDNLLDGDVTINVTDGVGTFSYEKAAGYTGTVTVVQTVTVSMTGVTRGTPILLQARETVGDVTDGDTVFEGFADANGEISFSHNYEGDLDLNVRARNGGVAVAAIADDGGAFTDETVEAADATTNDMNLLPATPVVDDAYYFGHTEQFPRIRLDISDVNGTGSTIVWEYWDGLAWTALSAVVDGTSNFETSGDNIVSWTVPGDWALTSVTGQINTGTLYYVRARITVLGSANQTRARKCTIDATRYKAFPEDGDVVRTIISTGLAIVAVWVVDDIGKFTQE